MSCRPRRSWEIAASATTCLLLVLFLVAPAARSARASAAPCNGAALPVGYALTSAGMPYALHVPYANTTAYNPTSISLFIGKSLDDARNTSAQQLCLADLGADALLRGSVLRVVPGSSPQVVARWYPYPFAFAGSNALPLLQPGWISGLAQASALGVLGELADRTGVSAWTEAARQTFNSYLVPYSAGGFVTTDRGRTWFQEYPTSPPTYVLNGHQEATIALAGWYQRSGDPRAYDLFRRGVAASETALPTHAVVLPQGQASVYDGLRGWTSAPVRAATGSSLRVSGVTVVDAAGHDVQGLSVPVGPPPVYRANLTVDPSFSTWSAGLPIGWRRSQSTIASAVRPNGTGGLRILSTGLGADSITQVVPSSKLVQKAWYRVSWRAREILPAGKPGTSGRVTVTSVCTDGGHQLGAYSAVRGGSWATYDLLVLLPKSTGCSLIVRLGQVDGTIAGTATDYDDVAVSLPQYASGPAPTYPLVALDGTPGHLRLTYTGTGEIQTWVSGRWWKVAGLGATTVPRTVTVSVPEIYTGVNAHLGYHELHVLELSVLYRLTGEQTLLDYARRWIPLAPSRNGILDAITASPLPAPAASTPTASPTGSLSVRRGHHLLKVGPAGSPALTWTFPDLLVTAGGATG